MRYATWLLISVGLCCGQRITCGDGPVSFREEVRPLLAAACFKCHGPDPAAREADLRLDESAAATKDRGGYAAITPGNASSSALYQRITSSDEAERMPPPQAKRQLSDAEREILRRWIEQGAPYEPHWSFVAPARAPSPDVSDPSFVRNDIDRFVLAELDRHGLRHAPQADAYQLVRRLYLDLIGLPPTPEEADEFVRDARPDAYERLVDRLLASPHYGERWARRWLDLARYSDTNGYEKDRPRTMWPYRDWVIDAINADMPFDQFTIEQLAGDMLPGATASQRIATGFHRNTMVNEEGGIDPQEFRFNAVVDRVSVTGAVWLGLTLGCAQCHTHKYDPITHEEYYRVFAIFNNCDEIEEHLLTDEIVTQRKERVLQIETLNKELEAQLIAAKVPGGGPSAPASADQSGAAEDPLGPGLERWKREVIADLDHWHPVPPQRLEANLADMEVLADHSVLVGGDVTKNDVYELEFEPGEQSVAAIRIEALTHGSLPDGGPGRQSIDVPGASAEGDFFLSELAADVIAGSGSSAEVVERLDFASAAVTFVAPGLSGEGAFDGRSDTGWRVLGRQGEPHAGVFTFRTPTALAPGQRLRLRLQHESFYPAGLGRFRVSFASPASEHPLSLVPDDIAAIVRLPESEQTAESRQALRTYFLQHCDEPALKLVQTQIAELVRTLPRPIATLIMQERTRRPRTTHRHDRGQYLAVAEAVAPGAPAILPPLPANAPANRLTFARWLVDPKHPLVARVFVNRQWQAFFGRGLVTTLEDFGLQGEYPSHPALLDYLAREFVDGGWSMKKLHKLIVMSAVYRQSAVVTPELLAKDPENRFLARAPRFRVEAELIRDIALAASGLLSPKIGGPSVFPDQPPGVTESAYGPLEWKTSPGEDRYRRGLYTFNKRTAPFAAFGVFDAPSGEACIARRNYSNTPLQSLALLNDVTTAAAARRLALTAASNTADSREIASTIFRRCVTRPPDEEELAAVHQFYVQIRERIANGEVDAKAILRSEDDAVSLPEGRGEDLAAWMLTARALLNLDETISRQ